MQNSKLWAWQFEISPQKCISFTPEDRTIMACHTLTNRSEKLWFRSQICTFQTAWIKITVVWCLRARKHQLTLGEVCTDAPWHLFSEKGTVPDSFWTQPVQLFFIMRFLYDWHLCIQSKALFSVCPALVVGSAVLSLRAGWNPVAPGLGNLCLLSCQAPRDVFKLWWKMYQFVQSLTAEIVWGMFANCTRYSCGEGCLLCRDICCLERWWAGWDYHLLQIKWKDGNT